MNKFTDDLVDQLCKSVFNPVMPVAEKWTKDRQHDGWFGCYDFSVLMDGDQFYAHVRSLDLNGDSATDDESSPNYDTWEEALEWIENKFTELESVSQ